MYLFLLKDDNVPAYSDEPDGFVVSATGVQEARALASENSRGRTANWLDASVTTCECVGISYSTERVLLGSYRDG